MTDDEMAHAQELYVHQRVESGDPWAKAQADRAYYAQDGVVAAINKATQTMHEVCARILQAAGQDVNCTFPVHDSDAMPEGDETNWLDLELREKALGMALASTVTGVEGPDAVVARAEAYYQFLSGVSTRSVQ